MSLLKKANILLPNTDLQKWAVVACDQFTSQAEYWEQLSKVVENYPSTLNIIFPECYLDKIDRSNKIEDINQNMTKYLQNVLSNSYDGYVLVVRTLSNGKTRIGLVGCIDLEDYDYLNNNLSIRATEGTVLSRIPPRVEIRKDAPIESSHIMLLCNDKWNNTFAKLYQMRNNFQIIYDFDLNMQGGHITGFLIKDINFVDKLLSNIETDEYQNELYGCNTNFVYAVGDGNHSLATAKKCWEDIKAKGEQDIYPKSRYCLCELVNIYDEGLDFEPIHRVVFGVTSQFKELLAGLSGSNTLRLEGMSNVHINGTTAEIYSQITQLIDNALAKGYIKSVDYIHGDNALQEIVNKEVDSVGIYMPTINKSDLFDYVAKNGALPRKSFSMGEARDKRYYLECRKIK